ncbi:jerky protein homolog-like [Belonocnema kinseyi]|uniref:jerky protein homolog-like n=1 Tax=Belonocnema kinseyi TaxID=2817044 RepID=UPI00143DDCC1|nr:jerky protein homolog-like [Belonocnema kinseyi]
MPKVKKRQRLTFKEQYELADKVKSGASKLSILQKYGICEATYKRVLARESDLRNKVNSYEYAKKKSSKTSPNMGLDAAVLEWFKQVRDRGDPISGAIIKEKALILNEKLNGPNTFKASNGWLRKFKIRYGIRFKEEKLTSDSSGVEEFSSVLKAKIESENLKLDNIYNADESGILWRILMACTLASNSEEEEEEKESSEKKGSKDRVTALFCANASGNHRIPLLLIGKSEIPTCLINHVPENLKDQRLKKLEILGVIYTHQDSAWMDKSIFLLWYKDVFIPRVLGRQRKDGITGKVVLLLDNAPCHPSLDDLNAINENFQVLYLPPNVTASNQPIAQGLISTTKKLYKKELLRRLLMNEKSEGAFEFLKELDLPDWFGMLSLAWDSVKSFTVQKAWKPFLGDLLFRQSFALQEFKIKQEEEEEDPLSINDAILSESDSPTDLISLSDEICDQVSKLLLEPGYSLEKSREFLQKWFENNDNDKDCGWESSTDSDIVNFVTTRRCEPESSTLIESSESIFENADIVNFVTCGRLEPEIVPKIESIDPDIVNFVGNDRREPEIVNKIENSETVFENPEPMGITSSEGKPEIVTKIENSRTVLENSESTEITSSEAFGCLMKFKKWVKSRAKCLPKHLDCIQELENLAQYYVEAHIGLSEYDH